MRPRLPLPDADDVPVVVAARLSLSFPLLVSAVPLWAFDRTLSDPKPERCWFSDGGVSSNFPVHFFDAPLPQRPTFGIDLDGFHPDHPWQPDEARNVWLPGVAATPVLQNWHRFRSGEGVGVLADFANGLVRTMQNHADTALAHQPGYRERIVHVHHQRNEGGLNLDMPPEVVLALTRRGREAGRVLVREFGSGAPSSAWTGHRWVRYRAAIAGARGVRGELRHRLGRRARRRAVVPQARRAGGRPATAGVSAGCGGAPVALAVSDRLASAGEAARNARPVELGGPGSPQPEPQARIVPRD